MMDNFYLPSGELVENYGYIPRELRSEEENEIVYNSVPEFFKLSGETSYTNALGEKKIALFDLWKHPQIKAANGFEYPGIRQVTGSCVGAGGGNAVNSLAFADAIIRKDFETPLITFWLLPYGRSRYYLYNRYSRGEGSTGATFAKAVAEDGTVAAKDAPDQFENNDGLVWGRDTELKWSTGQVPTDLADAAKKRLVKKVARCQNADDVREAICNYYSVTCASLWGGMMKCPVVDGVLLNRRSTRWSHQMSILAWWEHPRHGELYWIHNQWGLDVHGRCPSGAPGGGFWVKKEEIDWICRGEEVFAFSQFDGFPANKIDSWYF